jgi:hypothetical protein
MQASAEAEGPLREWTGFQSSGDSGASPGRCLADQSKVAADRSGLNRVLAFDGTALGVARCFDGILGTVVLPGGAG